MKTCTIENNTITLNDSVLFSDKSTSFVDFSKKALKALQMDYPKFFKMDNLSKLAFLAAEVLLRPFSQSEKNSVALVLRITEGKSNGCGNTTGEWSMKKGKGSTRAILISYT